MKLFKLIRKSKQFKFKSKRVGRGSCCGPCNKKRFIRRKGGSIRNKIKSTMHFLNNNKGKLALTTLTAALIAKKIKDDRDRDRIVRDYIPMPTYRFEGLNF